MLPVIQTQDLGQVHPCYCKGKWKLAREVQVAKQTAGVIRQGSGRQNTLHLLCEAEFQLHFVVTILYNCTVTIPLTKRKDSTSHSAITSGVLHMGSMYTEGSHSCICDVMFEVGITSCSRLVYR